MPVTLAVVVPPFVRRLEVHARTWHLQPGSLPEQTSLDVFTVPSRQFPSELLVNLWFHHVFLFELALELNLMLECSCFLDQGFKYVSIPVSIYPYLNIYSVFSLFFF